MTELFSSNTFNIFLFASSIASIVSLFVSIWRVRKVFVAFNAAISIALSVFAAYAYFRYSSLRAEQASLEHRKGIARVEARKFIDGLPSVDYYNPGDSRGVALAGLAFLETQREVYPATFQLAQNTVRVDIEEARKSSDEPTERHRLEVAGKSMLALLRGIAGPEQRAY